MATIEKLVKAFEALKVFQPGYFEEEPNKKKDVIVSKKDKMQHLSMVADCICSQNLRNAPDFPKFLGLTMETFLLLCDDSETDIRMMADECLNRTIKTLLESNLGRLQVELYKEVKKNGPTRSLRAALWRFADLCHLIRPQKCRPYVVNLLPCLAKICRRPEESTQETLQAAMQKLCPTLMNFTNDAEIKLLIKAFLPGVRSKSATTRRTAAVSLTLICQECRKPHTFFAYLLTILLDMILPVDVEGEVAGILGVLLCLRHIIPHLARLDGPDNQHNLYGACAKEPELRVQLEQLIQVYQALLHFTAHADHNVVTASLETLHQLLRTPPPALLPVLTRPGALRCSAVYSHDLTATRARALSEAQIAVVPDDSSLEEDLEVSEATSLPNTANESSPPGEEDLPDSSESPEGAQFYMGDDEGEETEESRDQGDPVIQNSAETDDGYANLQIGAVAEEGRSVSPSSSIDSRTSAPKVIIESKSRPRLRITVSEDKLSDKASTKSANVDFDVSEAIQMCRQNSIRVGDIGSMTDSEQVALLHCARILCSRLLLTGYPMGLIPDRSVRVSVKALALGCMANLVSLYPTAFFQTLHCKSTEPGDLQLLEDVLLYTSHCDPQLKGNAALLIGNLLQATLKQTSGTFKPWLRLGSGKLTAESLVRRLLAITDDDTSVAARLGLCALRACLPTLLHSSHNPLGLHSLLTVLHLRTNPYWLVKVELLELLATMDFHAVAFLESLGLNGGRDQHNYVGELAIQQHALQEVLLNLLGDPDPRVRHAAASACGRLVKHLFYELDSPQQHPVVARAQAHTIQYLQPVLYDCCHQPEPLIHGLVSPFHFDASCPPPADTEAALSRLVAMVIQAMISSTSKSLTVGCIHALCLLSEEYLVTQYANAWCISSLGGAIGTSHSAFKTASKSMSAGVAGELPLGSGGGPLPIVLSLLTSSPCSLDLTTHQDALQLAGNLFSGAAYHCMRSAETSLPEGSTDELRWAMLSDRHLVPLADNLLLHLARLLNMLAHVLDEVSPGISKPGLPSLPVASSISPIKRKTKATRDDATASPQPQDKTKTPNKDSGKDVDRGRRDGLGAFHNLPHYMRLYEVLRGAYSNYKISLDLSTAEKFGVLLQTVLRVLAQVLEVACLPELSKHCEELLGYLRSTITMEASSSVLCVQQLLKALFGTNLASQWESGPSDAGSPKPGKATRLTSNMRPGLYHSCFTAPYTQFTQRLASATCRASTHIDHDDPTSLLSWLKKRAEKRIPAILKPGSKTDKTSIASYIRQFEPLVIKALKLYTVTSCLKLQAQVLDLLSQLVQLRVNYCLLDSDQIFIGFVIKQFEFIEEGQIRNSEGLVPHIFHFLVLLTYERFHSKSIIGMPKVIQLCDGIMASGQNPATHAIPALRCIVSDLFVLRGTNKLDAARELDTQREVVVSMLLRLVHHHEVLELLIVVLQQCQRESEERWKRLSRQLIDTLLPLLSTHQLRVDSQAGLDVLHRLFECVAPSVFRPVDILLKVLFAPPSDTGVVGLQSWLCVVLLMLRVLMSQSKEETVLSRLQELGLGICLFKSGAVAVVPAAMETAPNGAPIAAQDPLGVQSGIQRPISFSTAEETFARMLLQVVGVVGEEVQQQATSLTHMNEAAHSFLCQLLAHLLLYVTHMFQSGIYRRVANVAMTLLQKHPPAALYSIEEINTALGAVTTTQPLLTLHWCHILILLNYHSQTWWGRILHTPPKYVLGSPSGSAPSLPEAVSVISRPLNLEVSRRGGLILFCDYVCENLNDAEHMTWVIINHVNDLISLSQEPPIQDFISAIHRNSAASGLFIQAIHSRCDNLMKPSLVRQTLQCLEAIHLSQSGALLTLLIDKFLLTHHLSVARLCTTIACRRVEMLQAEGVEDCCLQLPLDDLDKLLQYMESTALNKRHPRLMSLLMKLRVTMCPEDCKDEETRGSKVPPIPNTAFTKEAYVRVVQERCWGGAGAQECAQLLQHLDYSSILNIIMEKECCVTVLEKGVAFGTNLTLGQSMQYVPVVTTEAHTSGVPTPGMHPLLQACELALLRRINGLINQLPLPHLVLGPPPPPSTAQNEHPQHTDPQAEQYREKMDDLFSDPAWLISVFQLISAQLRYLMALSELPWRPSVPEDSVRDTTRLAVLGLEVLCHCVHEMRLPSSDHLSAVLEYTLVILKRPQLEAALGHQDATSWACSAIFTLHHFLRAVLVLPGSKLVELINHDIQEEPHVVAYSDEHHAIRACDQISELVHCLKLQLNPHSVNPLLPRFLMETVTNIVVGLARLPLVNSYARTPPVVWTLGWLPSPSGDLKTSLPPLPLNYLQDKDVLQEFIYRVNALGWTSRQQFEETWMCLLGVLNPVTVGPESETGTSVEEEMERTQCVVLATRCITALLVQSTLTPQSGNPANSRPEHRPRDKPLAFLHTRVGKKLTRVRGMLEQELQQLRGQRNSTDHCHRLSNESEQRETLYVENLEQQPGHYNFGLGQLSVEAIWLLVGMLDPSQLLTQVDTDSQSTTDTNSSVDTPSPQAIYPSLARVSLSPDTGLERSSLLSGLDVHSCLQFLLELYGQLLTAGTRTPLMQINDTVKSVLALSDVFTEKQQYEWMLATLLDVYRTHPAEDELVLQYVIVGVCKAAAVCGMELPVVERVVKLVETAMRSTHLPTKIHTLYGSLYLIEAGMTEITTQILPTLTDYLSKTLASITHTTIHSQQHVLVMWATTFYIIENCQEDLRGTDFTPTILQLSMSVLSGPEDMTSLLIYTTILRGLERLLLADVLTKQDADKLVKLSVERMCLQSPQRALSALGLMLTCMYSGKQGDQWSPTSSPTQPSQPLDPDAQMHVTYDPEVLIVAMERVTGLFDRIRKGFPYESRVIARILPPLLADFFPAQDIMNKVIGEFLSNQQPHPQLMASVVFQVFEGLLHSDQQAVVQDWVLLSLSNFTQRTPMSMAVWSLTCFFLSASTNMWLRALLPHVVGRMGKMEEMDHSMFILAALDFHSQLTDTSSRRAFSSTFQSVADLGPPYTQLLRSLGT